MKQKEMKTMKRTTKVVIYVEGGNVQSVMADGDTPPEIVLIDADNLEEDFDSDKIEQIADKAQEGCRDLPVMDPDTSLACECNGEKCGAKVHPEDPYYSSPCGTFCSDCMQPCFRIGGAQRARNAQSHAPSNSARNDSRRSAPTSKPNKETLKRDVELWSANENI